METGKKWRLDCAQMEKIEVREYIEQTTDRCQYLYDLYIAGVYMQSFTTRMAAFIAGVRRIDRKTDALIEEIS